MRSLGPGNRLAHISIMSCAGGSSFIDSTVSLNNDDDDGRFY